MENLKRFNLQDNDKLSTLTFTDEEDWLELRTKGIGGSDIGAILGLNSYSSPLKIYRQKVEGYREDLSDNVFIKKGKDLEDLILTNYVQPHFAEQGYIVGKPDFMIINSDIPYFRANVDGLAYKPGTPHTENIIVEIKWVSEWAEVNWNGSTYNGVPPSYYAQVQLYMAVTGAKKAVICALFDKTWTVHYFEIPRNGAFIMHLLKEGQKFYQYHMLMRIPPKLDYELDKEAVVEAIKAVPEEKTESEELTQLVEKYIANNAKIKQAEEVQDQLKNLILDLVDKGCITKESKHYAKVSVVKSHTFNSSRFKKDNPELYEQYCEDKESPRLTIK